MSKLAYGLIAVCLLFALPSMAEEKPLSAAFFLQQGFEVVQTMPCNWDKQLANVTIFGYYGTQDEAKAHTLFQDIITPDNMEVFGLNLLIKFDPAIMTHAGNNKPLYHVGIDYQVTNQSCGSGFSGFGR